MKRPICGSLDCVECRAATNRLTRPPRSRGVVVEGAVAPTADQLRKHLRRYADPDKVGADQAAGTIAAVGEVAAQYGIVIDLPRVERTQRPRRPGLKARIRSHLERGVGWDTIMEMENLSPSRARRLRTELEGNS